MPHSLILLYVIFFEALIFMRPYVVAHAAHASKTPLGLAVEFNFSLFLKEMNDAI
jgi:hypothetical protein